MDASIRAVAAPALAAGADVPARVLSPPSIHVFSDDEQGEAGAPSGGSTGGMRRTASSDAVSGLGLDTDVPDDGQEPHTWKIVGMREDSPLPSVRYGHTAVLFEGSMFVFGGFAQEIGTLNDLWEFHGPTRAWRRLDAPGAPARRFYHTAVVFARAMYVFGGHSGHGGTYFNDIHVYCFDRAKWQSIEGRGEVPSGRRSHSCVVVQTGDPGVIGASALRPGDLFVFGGCGPAPFNELYRFTVGERRWELIGSAPAVPALKSHTAVLWGGRMFVFGGQTEQRTSPAAALAYDFAAGTWVRLASHGAQPAPRHGHSAVVHCGMMYVFGGLEVSVRGEVWRLCLRAQADGCYEWRRLECGGIQPRPRVYHTAVVHEDTILVFGGYATDEVQKRKHFRNDIVELMLDGAAIPPPSLDSDLRALLASPELADVRFIVEGRTVHAHRLILASRSEYFRIMFRTNMRESQLGEVHLPDVSHAVLVALLEFLYTDQVSLRARPELATELLRLAEQYALARLKALCVAALRPRVAAGTVVGVLLVAERYRAPSLKRACIEFIVQSVDEVCAHPSFALLKDDPDLLFEVMQRLGQAARQSP